MGIFDFAKAVIKDVKKVTAKPKKKKVVSRRKQNKKTKKKTPKTAQKGRAKKLKKSPRKTPQRKKPSKLIKPPVKSKQEKQIGIITHHFGKISVGIIKLTASLKVGDKIHIKGAHDDFTQVIKSMQLNHNDIVHASKGSEIGIKVKQPVHENDRVYKAQ